jgi:hypothetical protein
VKNGNPICEHGMDTRRENKDTQKYAENYNQEYDEIGDNMELYDRSWSTVGSGHTAI